MDRTVVHMDLDTFFVSCERLKNSELNNIPLIIGNNSDRGVVASCSYEARKFGVYASMPIKMALRMCPQARLVKGDMELYTQQSHLVTEIIQESAPVVEKSSIDEFFLDITGMDRFFGSYRWTDELTQKIMRETGLPISFGLSVNKTVSKIATGEGKPVGKIHINPSNIKPFLNPLSIKKIPMLGSTTYQLLSRIGIRKIETLSEMPPLYLQKLIGKNGKTLWEKANGIDFRPVEAYSERKSISTEKTFEEDSFDIVKMEAVLIGMVEKLGFQLRSENWLTSCVVVKIRYTNFDTETKQVTIPFTSCDHTLIPHVKLLFKKLYTRRMRIRLIGVSFTSLVHGNYQINLFEDTEELVQLYQAIDHIKKRFGEKAIRRSITL